MASMAAADALDARVAAMRAFNRFYTRRIGVLRRSLWETPLPLAEARVFWELAQRDPATATEVGRALDLDLGHLSRLLQALTRRKLVSRRASETDARARVLALTAEGRKLFAKMDAASRHDIRAILEPLADAEQASLLAAMGEIERILDGPEATGAQAFVLREPRAGDYGWVVQAHGAIYAAEYRWDTTFEGLVAEIVAAYLKNHDPALERAWIAEREGENVGAVFCVKQSATVAKLRLLILDPRARGLGIGRRLVDECIRFAREKGYRKLVLWTQSNLLAARGIYKAAGFVRTGAEKNRAFGADLVSENWELKL
jgi:DNA-binding MarR family transcriptional regulator/GNAT superfamily N-acetyltransferase